MKNQQTPPSGMMTGPVKKVNVRKRFPKLILMFGIVAVSFAMIRIFFDASSSVASSPLAIKAQEEFQKKTKPNAFHFYIRPVYQFLNQYLVRLGFLDGKKGIIICYLNALSVSVRFQELKKINSSRI